MGRWPGPRDESWSVLTANWGNHAEWARGVWGFLYAGVHGILIPVSKGTSLSKVFFFEKGLHANLANKKGGQKALWRLIGQLYLMWC